jgi:oligopeptide transport system substrate-binding protein
MKLGLTYHNAFQFPQARQAYEDGFALWQRAAATAPAALPPTAPHPLRFIQGGLNTLDPTIVREHDSLLIIQQLFSGLLELTPEMEAVPDVARGWEVSPDGRRYIFHLRDDVRWSDRTPLTAADFQFSWKRQLDPATGNTMASFLYDIKGARAFHQGEISDPDGVGVRALDSLTLEVELEEPTSYFPLLIATVYPVPRHVVQAHGEAWAEPEHLVTNGPFKLESWRRGESMVLVRNPHYHAPFGGNVERVELLHPPEDPSQVFQMYEDDRLDVISAGPLLSDHDRQRHADELMTVPLFTTWWVRFNVQKPPFDDRAVRRAFVLATDRERLADVLLKGFVSPASGGFVPPGMPGHSPGIGLPYAPEQARQLLAEAGYSKERGRDFPPVELQRWDNRVQRLVTDELAAQWRENLGVEIKLIEQTDYATFEERMTEDPPHMHYNGWAADYPDPDAILRLAFSGLSLRGWHHPTFQRLVEEARRLTDQKQRLALYRQADRIVVEEAPIIPLYHPRFQLLVKPWIKGFLIPPAAPEIWKSVIIEPHDER